MVRVLLVDDSKADQLLASSILSEDPQYEVACAGDGLEALESMRAAPPDLVLTDLFMPRMDGLALVGRVRHEFPRIPIILMTGAGSEEIASKALRNGASSYVPKAGLSYDLLDTVRTVLTIARRQRDEERLVSQAMVRSDSAFVLDNEGTLVPTLIEHLQGCATLMGLCDETERTQVGIALQEALNNACEHGNLEIDSELREGDLDRYFSLLKERRGMSPYRERRIFVEARITRQEARITIRDEGAGFDPDSLPDPRAPANLQRASGRGVLLMRTFMDAVRFNAQGNEVTLVKRAKKPTAP